MRKERNMLTASAREGRGKIAHEGGGPTYFSAGKKRDEHTVSTWSMYSHRCFSGKSKEEGMI